MSHPFEMNAAQLKAMELDFEEQLTDEEATRVSGGKHSDIQCISAPCPGSETGGDEPVFTTLALGEEGGDDSWQYKKPRKKPIYSYPVEFPKATTLAIGEEGGDFESWVG